MLITVQSVIHILLNGIRHKKRNGTLSIADIRFICHFDESTTLTAITDAFNIVLSGSPIHKFKVPVIVKLVYIVCLDFSRVCPTRGADLGAITYYIVSSIYESGAIPLLDAERAVIRESITDSVFLLTADIPIIVKRCRFGCF